MDVAQQRVANRRASPTSWTSNQKRGACKHVRRGRLASRLKCELKRDRYGRNQGISSSPNAIDGSLLQDALADKNAPHRRGRRHSTRPTQTTTPRVGEPRRDSDNERTTTRHPPNRGAEYAMASSQQMDHHMRKCTPVQGCGPITHHLAQRPTTSARAPSCRETHTPERNARADLPWLNSRPANAQIVCRAVSRARDGQTARLTGSCERDRRDRIHSPPLLRRFVTATGHPGTERWFRVA
eukprot:743695-Prymnesium_polylepis.3